MKRCTMFLALLVVGMVGLMLPASAGEAAFTETTNESIPTTLFVFVPCANDGLGEIVELSGDLHVLSRTTITGNGHVSITQRFQPQGISGVGLDTGDSYQATGETQWTQTFDGTDGFPFTYSYVNNFKIIGVGPDNNYLAHENVHVTVNADGTVTTIVDNLSIECR